MRSFSQNIHQRFVALRGAELDKHLIFSLLLYSASTKFRYGLTFSPHLAKPLLLLIFFKNIKYSLVLQIYNVNILLKFST